MELNDDEQTNQIPKRVINFDDINNDDQPPWNGQKVDTDLTIYSF